MAFGFDLEDMENVFGADDFVMALDLDETRPWHRARRIHRLVRVQYVWKDCDWG
jgi:hypothetical protein